MKNLIIKILKEEVERQSLSNIENKVLTMLQKQGFTNKSPRKDVIEFLRNTLAIEGIMAYEIYELFKSNYNKYGEYGNIDEPIRVDVKSRNYKTPNNTAREFVKDRIPFKGANTNGKYIGDSYVVSSYEWYPIFVWKNGQWYENKDKYSMSTSKQTSQLRPSGSEIIKVSTKELRDIINAE